MYNLPHMRYLSINQTYRYEFYESTSDEVEYQLEMLINLNLFGIGYGVKAVF